MPQHQDRAPGRYQHARRHLPRLASAVLALALAILGVTGASLSQATPAHAAGSVSLSGNGKSHLAQDAQWTANKLAGRIHRAGKTDSPGLVPNSAVMPLIANSKTLYLNVTQNTVEPPPQGWDLSPQYYTDNNFAQFCAEGATTNALYYWNQPINGYGYRTFLDPSNGLYTSWNDNANRSYLMYLATQSKPPSFGSAGEFDFGSVTTFQPDIRDVLNWEASGHNTSYWSTFYYILTWAYPNPNNPGTQPSLTASQLNSYITSDIYYDNVPVIVDVNASYLPSWTTTKTINHSVAIIGYNNTTGTYTYIETCGTGCGSNGPGVYTILQSQLYQGITHNPFGNGGQTGDVIW